MTQRNKM